MSAPAIPPEFICQAPFHSDACEKAHYLMKVPVRFPCDPEAHDQIYVSDPMSKDRGLKYSLS